MKKFIKFITCSALLIPFCFSISSAHHENSDQTLDLQFLAPGTRLTFITDFRLKSEDTSYDRTTLIGSDEGDLGYPATTLACYFKSKRKLKHNETTKESYKNKDYFRGSGRGGYPPFSKACSFRGGQKSTFFSIKAPLRKSLVAHRRNRGGTPPGGGGGGPPTRASLGFADPARSGRQLRLQLG